MALLEPKREGGVFVHLQGACLSMKTVSVTSLFHVALCIQAQDNQTHPFH